MFTYFYALSSSLLKVHVSANGLFKAIQAVFIMLFEIPLVSVQYPVPKLLSYIFRFLRQRRSTSRYPNLLVAYYYITNYLNLEARTPFTHFRGPGVSGMT